MSKITASDIAKAAKVSLSTVDRVLNNRGGVTADKEQRVLEWARKLNIDRALNQRAARTLRVAVLIQPPDNPFHAAIQRGFEAAAREHADLNIQFNINHIDPLRAAATVALIRNSQANFDALVITSAQNDEIASALRDFGRQGKPVLTLATDLREANRYAYVGPDNRRAGRIAGDLMGRFLGREGGEIIVISGMLSMIGHEEREMGFRAVLRERFPRAKVVEVMESLEKADRAGDLVFAALKSNPAIRGIYNASAGAKAVVDAMKALGKRDEIIFITHELTEDRRLLMREGMIDAIIDQGPQREVQTVVEAIAGFYGRMERVPESLLTPIHIHTIENC